MVGESQGRSRQCLDETGTSMDDVLPCIDTVGINRTIHNMHFHTSILLMLNSRSNTEILFFSLREEDQMWKFV